MTHKLITKKRMAITVRFFLRHPAKDAEGNRKPLSNPHPVTCRVTVDGIIDAGFSAGVRVDPDIWDQKGQKATGRSDQAQRVNKLLTQLKTKIEQIHDWQLERYDKKQGPKPTPKTVRHELGTGKRPAIDSNDTPIQGITLISALQSYVAKMRHERKTAIGRSKITISAYDNTLCLLKEFLAGNESFAAEEVTIGWARRFYTWILQQPLTKKNCTKRSLSTACRIVKRVSLVLDYLTEFQALPNGNPIARMKLQKSPDKEVYFLEPEQIDRLLNITAGDCSKGISLWWAHLIIITGMDYPDAIRFARNRDKFTRYTPYGQKITISRAKTGIISEIPVTGRAATILDSLFAQYPTGPRAYSHSHVNKNLNDFAEEIGFADNLTVKILRKTAGAWMLWRGFRLEAVSKALGHSYITTTQRYYVKITGTLIDLEMKRMYEGGGGAYMAA